MALLMTQLLILVPRAFEQLAIYCGKIQKTKVHKSSWTPCCGEERSFSISSWENDELVAEVYDHTLNEKFANTFRLLVSKLKPGIQVIPLSDEVGKPCSTARLLMGFMFA